MTKITRKVYKNNSNGQLLITAPKGVFNDGDEVTLELGKNAYEVILDKDYELRYVGDKKTSEYLQTRLDKLFNDDLEDHFCNGILEDTLYESWEDMSIMGVDIDFKINLVTNSTIDFNLRLTKRKNYDAPNEKMIEVLKSLLEDRDRLFNEIVDYIRNYIDFSININEI